MTIKQLWHKISFLGLTEDQEFSNREVLLLNKIVFVSSLAMLLIIPFEVIINGWGLVLMEVGMAILSALALLFNYLKQYTLAKLYFFFMALFVIVGMGVAVGGGSGNELFMIPGFIITQILFNKRSTILIMSLIAFLGFCAIPFFQDRVEPVIEIEFELKRSFRYVMYTIVFVIIFFEVYYFKNINVKYHKLLASKNDEIAEKNKEIVDSINYAQRIQDAYLPPKEVLSYTFPDSFLLFEPKDIVSGDFYWFYTPKENEQQLDFSFVMAADCTGHGVPGAIMSVICCNALNDVIVKGRQFDTGKILDEVRDHIVSILKTQGSNSRKDGMDTALVRINRKTGEVQYSGAHNPLWLLRSDSEEIEQFKADKQPVGAFENQTPFTTNDLQLKPGDQIYMFSDGYQDQFGGDKGKKFKAANLKKLILKNRHLPMDEQQQVFGKAFYEWKGDLEQVDDVVLIGIKF